MSRIHQLPAEVDTLAELAYLLIDNLKILANRVNELSEKAGLEPIALDLPEEVDEELEAAQAELVAAEAAAKKAAEEMQAKAKALKAKADAKKAATK